MKKLDKTQYGIALQNAVAYLKGKKIIRKEQEISAALKVSKVTVSSYVTGRQLPSMNFIEKFEQVYKLSLADFLDQTQIVEIVDTESAVISTLIRIESMVRVNSAYVSELYAKQASVPTSRVVTDMEQMAKVEGLRIAESMKKK
jgi:transcriptional regulator with XRE-family HTH domain